MYILPEKVSGFYDKGDTPPKAFPFSLFRKNCKQIDQQSEYSVLGMTDFPSQPNRSYYLTLLQHFVKGHFFIFCNRYYPLIAFSRLLDDSTPDFRSIEGGMLPGNEFIDLPELHALLNKEFVVLDKEYLATSVNADNPEDAVSVSKLSYKEFAEFSFWKPRVISDIIFNNWGD